VVVEKVYVVLTEAPMGWDVLAVCSTKEKAQEKVLQDLRDAFTEKEIREQLKQYGAIGVIHGYGYALLECEIDGECKEVE